MPFHLYHFFAFLISVTVVLLTTPIVRRIGLKSGRVDMPGGERYTVSPWCGWAGFLSFWAPLPRCCWCGRPGASSTVLVIP